MSGNAETWFSSLSEQEEFKEKEDSLLCNYEKFIEKLILTFDEPNRHMRADLEIRKLHQGRHSVASYAAKFQELRTYLKWDQDALISQF